MTITVGELRKLLDRLPENAHLKIRWDGGECIPRPQHLFLEGKEFIIVDTSREEVLDKIEQLELDVQHHGAEHQRGRWRVFQNLNSASAADDLHEGWGDTVAMALASLLRKLP